MSVERTISPIENRLNSVLGKYSNILLPLSETQESDLLEEKLESRFQTVVSMRKKFGLQESFELNFETAIALVDDNLFEQVLNETQQDGKTLNTARHEIGHANVAQMLGWHVDYISVVPSATYLGVTGSSPPSGLSLYDYCLSAAAISYGGIMAAQMLGDELKGGGSDMASAQAKARIVNYYYPQISENAFLSQAQSLAHQSLRSSGTPSMEKQAQVLLYEKVAA